MDDTVQSDLVRYNQLQKKLDEFYSCFAKICHIPDSVFWIIYSLLERQEPCTQTELCNMWSFHKQTINTALKNMESDGLIFFEQSIRNKKEKQIFLTHKGTAFAQKTVIPFMEMEKRAFGSLGNAERQEFLRLTQKHLELLQAELKKQLNL